MNLACLIYFFMHSSAFAIIKYAYYYLQSYKFVFKNYYCNLRKDIFYIFIIFSFFYARIDFHYFIMLKNKFKILVRKISKQVLSFYSLQSRTTQIQIQQVQIQQSRYKYRYSTLMTTVIQRVSITSARLKISETLNTQKLFKLSYTEYLFEYIAQLYSQ